MMAERWNQVMDTFSAVVNRSREQQQSYLDEVCRHDPDLRAQVEDLLSNHVMAETEEFLQEPPWLIDEIPVCLPDFEDYEHIEYISHGGMGVVYRAFDQNLERHIALKTILPHRLTTTADLSSFRVDPQSMAKLKHPNIVQVHTVGECDGKPYFTMNLIERKDGSVSLEKHLGRFRDDPAAAVRLMMSVARAIHHAHERGILHRDLKPGNILLDDEDNPHVTDFGLAKRIDSNTKLMATRGPSSTASVAFRGVVGTAKYISPEQADPNPNREVTTVSDVYGLGATLYTLLTGRPPFEADTLEEILQLVRDPEQKPTPPRVLNPRVDRTLEAICLKCLQKNPAMRYRSAEGLAKNFERWLRDEPTDPPQPIWVRFRNWCRRNPIGVGLIVVVLAFVGLAGWRIAEELKESARTQAASASRQATALRFFWLTELRDAVERTARETQPGKFLAEENFERLQKFIEDTAKDRVDLIGESPFASWFVVDYEGHIVAHSREKGFDSNETDLRPRDYFQGALSLANKEGGSPVYVSKVYEAKLTGDQYRLALSAALRHEGRIVGILAATVTTGDLRLPKMEQEGWETALLAQRDSLFVLPAEESDEGYVVLLHRAYQHRGDQPVRLPREKLPELKEGVLVDYRDPAAELNEEYKGRWLVAFAPVDYPDIPVEEANLVVVVQRRYSPLIPRYWWIALVIVVLLVPPIAILVHYSRRRMKTLPTKMFRSTLGTADTRPGDG